MKPPRGVEEPRELHQKTRQTLFRRIKLWRKVERLNPKFTPRTWRSLLAPTVSLQSLHSEVEAIRAILFSLKEEAEKRKKYSSDNYTVAQKAYNTIGELTIPQRDRYAFGPQHTLKYVAGVHMTGSNGHDVFRGLFIRKGLWAYNRFLIGRALRRSLNFAELLAIKRGSVVIYHNTRLFRSQPLDFTANVCGVFGLSESVDGENAFLTNFFRSVFGQAGLSYPGAAILVDGRESYWFWNDARVSNVPAVVFAHRGLASQLRVGSYINVTKEWRQIFFEYGMLLVFARTAYMGFKKRMFHFSKRTFINRQSLQKVWGSMAARPKFKPNAMDAGLIFGKRLPFLHTKNIQRTSHLVSNARYNPEQRSSHYNMYSHGVRYIKFARLRFLRIKRKLLLRKRKWGQFIRMAVVARARRADAEAQAAQGTKIIRFSLHKRILRKRLPFVRSISSLNLFWSGRHRLFKREVRRRDFKKLFWRKRFRTKRRFFYRRRRCNIKIPRSRIFVGNHEYSKWLFYYFEVRRIFLIRRRKMRRRKKYSRYFRRPRVRRRRSRTEEAYRYYLESLFPEGGIYDPILYPVALHTRQAQFHWSRRTKAKLRKHLPLRVLRRTRLLRKKKLPVKKEVLIRDPRYIYLQGPLSKPVLTRAQKKRIEYMQYFAQEYGRLLKEKAARIAAEKKLKEKLDNDGSIKK